jgi:hypothetical protein
MRRMLLLSPTAEGRGDLAAQGKPKGKNAQQAQHDGAL